jgi:hypothetical protein
MGLLGGLFGRSKERRTAATDRCMECGMTGDAHTEWCPAVAEGGTGGTPPPDAGRSGPPLDEAAPPS